MRAARQSKRSFRGPAALLLVALVLIVAWRLHALEEPAGRSAAESAASPAGRTQRLPPATIAAAGVPAAPAQWTACGALQCATVTVPLDYAQPRGQQIGIAVARHGAEIPSERIGSLVINPGGPGGSGIDDLANEMSVMPQVLLDRFDIVSFDPRGVGRSSPVSCSGAGNSALTPSGPLPDPVPSTTAGVASLEAADRAFGQQCLAASGELLAHVGTVDTARDLEQIRMALGDARLTFVGHSYGTLLGATYAELYPTHVRAMVLDGAIDPAESAEQMVVDQSAAFEAELDNFFSWCAASNPCAWRPPGDPTAALLALIQAARSQPLPAGGGRLAGPGELYFGVLSALYSQSAWPALGAALAQASAGSGADLVAMSEQYQAGGSPNADDALPAIDCLDHPVTHDLTRFPALVAASAVKAPVFGPMLAWGLAQCATWPVAATRTPAAAAAPGAPPIVVVGTTGDPATPYRWAQALASELRQGVLVTWQGESHVAYFYSPCVRSIYASYLTDLVVPPSGSTCSD